MESVIDLGRNSHAVSQEVSATLGGKPPANAQAPFFSRAPKRKAVALTNEHLALKFARQAYRDGKRDVAVKVSAKPAAAAPSGLLPPVWSRRV